MSIARNLSDKAQDAWNIAQNLPDKPAFELHMGLGSFAGASLAFSQLAAAGSETASLEKGARRLVDQAKEIDALLGWQTSRRIIERWRLVQDHIRQLSEAYRLDYRTQAGTTSEGSGYFRWKGRVDGSDWIMLRGDAVTIRHLANKPIKDSSYDLRSSMPCRQLMVQLKKLRGRGKVEIIQQPGLFNDCTAIVLLEDPQGGDDTYEFELTW
ncbi:MAG: hypothetical protein HXY20_07895 [Acidobacteria bacterium]|nr:hypothetical protein [Acidobacteriota bacterium]